MPDMGINGAARGNRTLDLSLTNKPDYLTIFFYFNDL